jgi:hypothetical protein
MKDESGKMKKRGIKALKEYEIQSYPDSKALSFSAFRFHLSSFSSFDPLKKSGPVSRVLSRRLLSPLARDDGSDGMAIPLGRASRRASSNLPGNLRGLRRARTDRSTVALFGLAPDGVYPATRLTAGAVSSYLAVSPLPLSRRFVFCGTFHRLAASGR